ncbi:hypothetical protein [Leptolyngbya sp. FACHB-261]|uniref:hypothetical protein n=1 Tax=Leptolyngbya sp. FACHB-261 TaxID=2692806 RepID=UPI001688A87F|nr:hypothetical protein [Leptolyngbya sp. FACHB-261]MBD2099643.1 hypothetical protein [Leptolyngbya sp. FACHB-261]
MSFIKVGSRILNTQAIAWVELEAVDNDGETKTSGVRVYFIAPSGHFDAEGGMEEIEGFIGPEDFFFRGQEAEALRQYFTGTALDLV